jgi:hypothetical protein
MGVDWDAKGECALGTVPGHGPLACSVDRFVTAQPRDAEEFIREARKRR